MWWLLLRDGVFSAVVATGDGLGGVTVVTEGLPDVGEVEEEGDGWWPFWVGLATT